jgi:hypothetical protein
MRPRLEPSRVEFRKWKPARTRASSEAIPSPVGEYVILNAVGEVRVFFLIAQVFKRKRVNVQLINAENDEHLWAEDYDRDLTDVFAIQTDLAKK